MPLKSNTDKRDGAVDGLSRGLGRSQPTITVLVPWTQEFGCAYERFINCVYRPSLSAVPYGGAQQFGGGYPLGGQYPVAGPVGGYGPQLQGYPIGFGVTTAF